MPGRRSIVTACSGLLISAATPCFAQGQQQYQFKLRPEPLAQALRDVAVQTGRNIIAPADLVRALQAPALTGTFTTEQAVARLIAKSGLRYRSVGGALVIEASSLTTGLSPASAGPVSGDIVVTGTHVRGASPTSPLIVLTRKDIDKTGATSVDELMRTLPQNSESGVNKENFLISLPAVDPTDHGASINLRGLGQRATLVLLDGRRLAPSGSGGFVDVSMIPMSAIERVDVVTDGASAIYGSDAVGGVVNFVLRDHFDGLETTVQTGTTTGGGGSQFVVSQAAGKSWGSGHALLAYEYRLEDEIKAGQRHTAGEPSDTYLLPRERKHSLLASIGQELAPGLKAGITATWARRLTDRTTFQAVSPLPVKVDAKASEATIAGELKYDLPKGWLLSLDGNYAVTTTSQLQNQPGGIPVVNNRDIRSTIGGGELHLDGPLFELPAGAVRAAIGGEVRLETYRQLFSSSTFAPVTTQAHRSVDSVYGELAVPLFSPENRRRGFEVLQLSAAARCDRYARTSSSCDPKLGVLWSPARGLNLRGSYSTSFRAPLLSETTGVYDGILEPARFFFVNPSLAPSGAILLYLQGSNPNVKPETSRNVTLGADWSPTFVNGLKLTANYYSIRYSNRIDKPSAITSIVGNPAYNSIVQFNPNVPALAAVMAGAEALYDFSGPGFTNGHATASSVFVVLDNRISNTAYTSTSGIDLTVHYTFRVGSNDFTAQADVTHIFKFEDQLRPNSPVINDLDHPYLSLSWRGRGGFSWANAGWNGSLFVNYAGHYTDNRTAALNPISAYATVDASLSYAFGVGAPEWLHGTRISLYAENLFDADPPYLAPDPGRTIGIGYDPVNASARGRFVAVQLRKSW